MDETTPDVATIMSAFQSEVDKVLGPWTVGDFVVIAEVTPASGETILANVCNDVDAWRETGILAKRLNMIAADPPDRAFGPSA